MNLCTREGGLCSEPLRARGDPCLALWSVWTWCEPLAGYQGNPDSGQVKDGAPLNLKGPFLFLRNGVTFSHCWKLRRWVRVVSVDTPALVQSFSNLGMHHGHQKTPESAGCWALPSRKGGVQEFAFPLNSQVALLQDPWRSPTLVLAASPDAERPDGSLTL